MDNSTKTIEEWSDSLFALQDEIYEHEKLEMTDEAMPLSREDEFEQTLSTYGAQDSFPPEYRAVNGFEMVWHAQEDPSLNGVVKFLTVDQVLSSWEEIFYFKAIHGEDHEMRKYRPLDMPTGELSVGIFSDAGKASSLYLLKRGNDPINLDLDILGYVQLLFQSRGFIYWQRVLASHKQGIANEPAAAAMEAGMTKLFPEFSMEAFLELYDSLRLSQTN